MNILTFPLGQLRANCYFLTQDKESIIIDPADDASFILEEIQRRGLDVKALLATHGHFDHVMAVGEIQAALPRVPFFIHKNDTFLLKRLEETAKHFLGYEPYILQPKNITSLNIKTPIREDFQFQIIHTPGHTPGSVSYHFPIQNIIFTGDTLFAGTIGRYDFSYSDKHELKNSLGKLFGLPKTTVVYPGHGERSSIGIEKMQDTSFLK